ncbi:hypothetical protein DD237_006666 [Peronospora effusa]|uniref:Purple acid phosphatase N-terminal domain-containing protein n=1 Tax=Peronospora effusa TaxID=542832 RepID=A0A3R7W2P9_9STRA|nr:hypothetical protein DD237_006666 [Peronospora effusa]
MTENDTSGSYCCLWKRRTAFVTVALCGLVGSVLIAFLDLPLNLTKDLVEVKEFELKTYPPLIESGGDLVVSWERNNATTLTNHDYVTLSCGPTTGEGDYFYNKTVRVSDLSVRFSSLYMMRCNYTAIYYNYEEITGKHKTIAKVETGMKEPAETPKHGHLSFTDDEKAMAIMFNSGTSKTPMVKYGMKPDDLKFYATGTSTTYGADDMCHAPATTVGQIYFRDPGYMHTVIMTDLKPNTYYFYQYGHEEHGLSQVHRFKSRPLSSYKYANFIAYGDMGAFAAFYGGSESTAARAFKDVIEGEYDSFLLHFGDISYARSQGHVWDQFFHLIEPYATRVPYMVSIGNRKYNMFSCSLQDCATDFARSWNLLMQMNMATLKAGSMTSAEVCCHMEAVLTLRGEISVPILEENVECLCITGGTSLRQEIGFTGTALITGAFM